MKVKGEDGDDSYSIGYDDDDDDDNDGVMWQDSVIILRMLITVRDDDDDAIDGDGDCVSDSFQCRMNDYVNCMNTRGKKMIGGVLCNRCISFHTIRP